MPLLIALASVVLVFVIVATTTILDRRRATALERNLQRTMARQRAESNARPRRPF